MPFCRKIQQRTLGPGESAAGVSLEIHSKNLVIQGRAQLEHNSHIVKVGAKATCLHFNHWHYIYIYIYIYIYTLKETTEPSGPFEAMPQEPWHPGKGAKLDCITHLNCREVRTHTSYKTTKTLENCSNQGTKWSCFQKNYD